MTDQQTPAFIDFEASSLDLVASYPIEVGVCLADGEPESWLIRPHVLWQEWSDSAQRIHGIRRELLDEQGQSPRAVAETLNRLLPESVYCDAWTFDRFWLHRLYRAAGLKPTFTLESVALILTPAEVDLWASVRASVIHEMELATHRAGNDARILHETWKRIAAQRSSWQSAQSG